MSQQTGALRALRNEAKIDRAVVFLHGFTGSRDDTWAAFPNLLATEISDWNIFTVGYATTLLPDVIGIWSADPDLTILAELFRSELIIPPLGRHGSVAIVAHSMGGLVAQKTLVDNPELDRRISHLVLFGAPSNGLIKAGLARLWKRQLRNMAWRGPFIQGLRAAWTNRFADVPPFRLTVVAGANDQFVPPESSLSPFDRSVRRVVPGDHLQIVKPESREAESLRLLSSILSAKPEPSETTAPLRLAAELGASAAGAAPARPAVQLTMQELVDGALALERDGDRDGAMALLEDALKEHPHWTDSIGALGGRIKRIWLEKHDRDEAYRAMALYRRALDITRAEEPEAHDKIYYHAINLAFFQFVVFDDAGDAREMAELALRNCRQAPDAYWNTATQAEAHLHLGEKEEALALYRQAVHQAPEPWMVISSGVQAAEIAMKLGDQALAAELEAIFTPGSRQSSKIFVGYSHRDSLWLERFQRFIFPYLKVENAELELWTDAEIGPDGRWSMEITEALNGAGVAVVFVSADFLASDFIISRELPSIMKAAEDGTMRLLWVYLSPAAIDAVNLDRFQAAHDVSRPLSRLEAHEQDQALLDIARKVKAAALGAVPRFLASAPSA